MKKQVNKHFKAVKEDFIEFNYLVFCKELESFYFTNIEDKKINKVLPVCDNLKKIDNSTTLSSQYFSKKLGGNFYIEPKSYFGLHFYLILEKSKRGIDIGNTLIFTDSFQSQLKQALYWKRIDEKASILLQCLAKKDSYTAGHTKRVGILCKELAIRMKLSKYQINVCYYSGLLHDVGKIAIDDSILKKSSALTDDEYMVMKKHPVHSFEVLKDHFQNNDIVDGVKFHHEKFDGSGYPNNLSGEEIPLASRIVAVADTFDALISHRPYRKGVLPVDAIIKLKEIAPGQLDEKIVDIMIEYVQSTQMGKKRKKAA